MMMRNYFMLIALSAIVALAGCQRFDRPVSRPPPPPLQPAPVAGVQSGQLAAPSQDQFPETPETPETTPAETQNVAAAAPPVTRDSMVGRWTISTGGSNCDVFLALTQWTGGYRAASRGCANQASTISAWDVTGNQVVLNDANGSRFAGLFKTGEQRFEGTTSTGETISLSR